MKYLNISIISLLILISMVPLRTQTIDKELLSSFYAITEPDARDGEILDILVDEILPLVQMALPEDVKKHLIRQSLNAWRGVDSIPIVTFYSGDRSMMNDQWILRDMMTVVEVSRFFWPLEHNWSQVKFEIYFDQLYLSDGAKLNQAFPDERYQVSLKEKIVTDNNDKTTYYQAIAEILVNVPVCKLSK